MSIIRKTILTAAAALGASALAIAAPAYAKGPHGNGHDHYDHHDHYSGFYTPRSVVVIEDSCWRWVPTKFGVTKVYLCNY
ncbi:MAG: hypothetical protein ACJ8F3_12775 [Xanthobacteraceae bacterium]